MPTLDQVRQALACLYDPVALAQAELCRCFADVRGQAETQRRAQAMRSILLDAIETLQRPSSRTPLTASERGYELLSLHFVQRLPLAEAADEMSVSARQAYRDLSQAVLKLAEILEPMAQDTAGEPTLQGELRGLELRQSELDLNETLAELIEVVRPLAESRSAILSLELFAESARVTCEPTLLRQLLLGIMSWAIRHARGRVGVTIGRDGADLALGVSFPVTEEAVPGPAEETLGLARTLGLALEPSVADGLARVQLNLRSPRTRTVLVIEDNPGVVELYRRILQDAGGYELFSVPAAAACATAEASSPDAVILDLLMPGLDGWAVLKALQENPRTQAIPVIVCSVFDERELALTLGASELIKKPVTSHDLLRVLSQCRAEHGDGSRERSVASRRKG